MAMTQHWIDWEDYQAGMYDARLLDVNVSAAAFLLTDPGGFHESAREMLREWPRSAHQNLHFMWSGRNAWVGQATCCYSVGATAAETRHAWGSLTNQQQDRANAVARLVRAEWAKGVHDAETLFGD